MHLSVLSAWIYILFCKYLHFFIYLPVAFFLNIKHLKMPQIIKTKKLTNKEQKHFTCKLKMRKLDIFYSESQNETGLINLLYQQFILHTLSIWMG